MLAGRVAVRAIVRSASTRRRRVSEGAEWTPVPAIRPGAARRRAADERAVRDVAPDVRAAGDLRARADRQMSGESGLAADLHVVADRRRAGEPGLRGDRACAGRCGSCARSDRGCRSSCRCRPTSRRSARGRCTCSRRSRRRRRVRRCRSAGSSAACRRETPSRNRRCRRPPAPAARRGRRARSDRRRRRAGAACTPRRCARPRRSTTPAASTRLGADRGARADRRPARRRTRARRSSRSDRRRRWGRGTVRAGAAVRAPPAAPPAPSAPRPPRRSVWHTLCARVDERFVGQHRGRARGERRSQKTFVGRERQRGRIDVVDRRDAGDRARRHHRSPGHRSAPRSRRAFRGRRSRGRRRLFDDLEDLLDVGRDVDAAVADELAREHHAQMLVAGDLVARRRARCSSARFGWSESGTAAPCIWRCFWHSGAFELLDRGHVGVELVLIVQKLRPVRRHARDVDEPDVARRRLGTGRRLPTATLRAPRTRSGYSWSVSISFIASAVRSTPPAGGDRTDDGRDAALLRDEFHFTADLGNHLFVEVCAFLFERANFQLRALRGGRIGAGQERVALR